MYVRPALETSQKIAAKHVERKGYERSGACAKLKAVTGKCQTRHSAERIKRDRRYDGYIKPVVRCIARTHVSIESFISLFLSPPSLFHYAAPVFWITFVHTYPDVLFLGPRNRVASDVSNGHLPISDIRLPATAFHFALTINYRPLSSLLANIPDLIISGVIFVSFKQLRTATAIVMRTRHLSVH